MIAQFAGFTLAEADEARRALGDVEGMAETKLWFFPRALGRGYPLPVVERIWKVLEAFASFGFCKAHAAAFALPTYQSAWLKAHWPAHFLAGVLTHDPGMYPKRLILDDARQFGIAVLGLDVNASETRLRRASGSSPDADGAMRVRHPAGADGGQGDQRGRGGPDRRGPALPLAHRLLAPRPGLPAGARAAGAGRRVRLGLRHRRHGGRRRPPPRQGHPARPAAPGGRARPARPRGRPGRPRPGLAGRSPRAGGAGPVPTGVARGRRRRRPQQLRPAARESVADARAAPARPRPGSGRRRPPSPRPPRRRRRSTRCSSPSTSATRRPRARFAACRR